MDRVVNWLERHETELAVNPIVLGELQYGILLLPSGRRRTRLLEWFSAGVTHLPVLDLDAATARIWAEMIASLRRRGYTALVKDSLIAASAKQHHLKVATRTVVDFRRCGVAVVNPFSDAAGP